MVMLTLGPARSRLLERVTAPVAEPLTLEETKLYLRVDHAQEDALIGDLITSARVTAEHWLRRSLMTQRWRIAFDHGVPDCLWLPMGPVVSVDSVTLVDASGAQTALGSATYRLNAARDRLTVDTAAPALRAEITYSTGYGNAQDVPAPIRAGLLAHVAQLYDDRGDAPSAALPAQAAGLYLPFREVRL